MNINKGFFFLFSRFIFLFHIFFSSFFLMVLFISVTVRCSRQQLLTAVGLSQRGVREGGREGAGRGPSSSPLLLLFCCFSAAPSLARSLALQRSGGRRRRTTTTTTRRSIWTKNEREKLHPSFILLARSLLLSCSENSNPCKSFFLFF